MASKQSTVDFIVEQLQDAGDIRSRKMFGEYALYCNDKVVALVCDDQLFVKQTDAGRSMLEKIEEAPPYPSAKPHFLISEEHWEDRQWLSTFIAKAADEVPLPKPKKK